MLVAVFGILWIPGPAPSAPGPHGATTPSDGTPTATDVSGQAEAGSRSAVPTATRSLRQRLVDRGTGRAIASTAFELSSKESIETRLGTTDENGWFLVEAGDWQIVSVATPAAFRPTAFTTDRAAPDVGVDGVAWLRLVVEGASPRPARVLVFPAGPDLETAVSWQPLEPDRMAADRSDALWFEAAVPSTELVEVPPGERQLTAAHPALGGIRPPHPDRAEIERAAWGDPSRVGDCPVSAEMVFEAGQVTVIELHIDATLALRIRPGSFDEASRSQLTLHRFHRTHGNAGRWREQRRWSGRAPPEGIVLEALRPARYLVGAVGTVADRTFLLSSQQVELDGSQVETAIDLDRGVGPWSVEIDTGQRRFHRWWCSTRNRPDGEQKPRWAVYGSYPIQGAYTLRGIGGTKGYVGVFDQAGFVLSRTPFDLRKGDHRLTIGDR